MLGKKENKSKIDRETSENEFDRFCNDWYIGNDISAMNEEDQASFEKFKQQLIMSIMDGRLVYNDDETLSYTISGKLSADLVGSQVNIRRPKGDSYMEMDRFKDGQNMRKMYAMLGTMISKPVQFISRLDGIDLKIIQSVQTLFLAG